MVFSFEDEPEALPDEDEPEVLPDEDEPEVLSDEDEPEEPPAGAVSSVRTVSAPADALGA